MPNPKVYYIYDAGLPRVQGDWTTYRSGIAAVDTEPVGLLTPATLVTTYQNTVLSRATSTIQLGRGHNLHIRGKANADADLVVTVVVWGKDGLAGHPILKQWTLAKTGCRDGDGAAGSYLTEEVVIPIEFFTDAHVFLTNLGTATSAALEFAIS